MATVMMMTKPREAAKVVLLKLVCISSLNAVGCCTFFCSSFPRFPTIQENQYTLSFLGAIDDAKDAKDGGEVGADSAAALAATGPSAKRMRVP